MIKGLENKRITDCLKVWLNIILKCYLYLAIWKQTCTHTYICKCMDIRPFKRKQIQSYGCAAPTLSNWPQTTGVILSFINMPVKSLL